MTNHTEEEWRKMFDSYDGNKDGEISIKEVERLMQYYGYNPTSNDVTAFMKAADKDANGSIDFKEFYDYMMTLPDPLGELREAFHFHDKNGDGYIDKEEFKGLLVSGSISDDDIEDLFKLIDINKDGKIQYEEFVELFSK